MSSEQTTQETVPVEKTETSTEPVRTEPTTETKPEVTTTTTTTTSSWKESISEQYRNDPNIEKFTEIDALAKSYINATKMIGQDKVVIPTNNSTEEAWNDVYDKLGRPESAEKYSLDAKSEVVNFDEAAIKSFAEQSHKLGLNNKQAQGILEFYKNNYSNDSYLIKKIKLSYEDLKEHNLKINLDEFKIGENRLFIKIISNKVYNEKSEIELELENRLDINDYKVIHNYKNCYFLN